MNSKINYEINYEIDNCITNLDTLITLDKRAMQDLENNTHGIEQQEVLTIIREFIRLRNDYNKEKEKNKALKEGLKYRINYCKLLEKELYANGVNYDFEKTQIEKQFLEE